MKNAKKTIAILLVLSMLSAVISLSSCKTKLVYEEGYFYCSKNKVTYKEVSYQYLPVSISTEVYAELNEMNTKSELFALEGVEPEKWLATADGRLFCAADISVPSLEQMEVDSIFICKEGTNMSVALASITSDESVSIVLGNMLNGFELKYPLAEEAEELLSLRFASSKYPWLYYTVSYMEFENDIIDTDNVADMDTYVYRRVDDSVTVTTVFEYECWYITDNEDSKNLLINIAQSADIDYATVVMPDGNGGVNEYVGLYFHEIFSLEDCVSYVISNYDGTLSDNELHTFLDYPDIEEKLNVVEYNYGKYLIYDRANGKCVKADGLIHEYKENTKND